MQKKIFFTIVICLFIISALPLSARDKDRVAVLDFDSRNCPQAISKVITDMVGAKVFETHIFTIVERGQINQVFKELELHDGKILRTVLRGFGKATAPGYPVYDHEDFQSVEELLI